MVRVNGLADGCYIRPFVYLGYGEMGLNPLPCPVNVAIAAWPWGTYLGDEGVANGRSMKISSWPRHDPNAMPTAAKGTGKYVNSSLAKVEALKAGYDEAIMLDPDGHVSECTGENIFIVRKAALLTPPTSDSGHSRASPRSRSRPCPRPRLRHHLRADHPHRPLHRRRDVPDRHRRRGGADPRRWTTARSGTGSPGRSPRSSSRPTSPPCAGRSTSTRTGWIMSSDGPTLNDESSAERSAAVTRHSHGDGRATPTR